MVPLLKGTHRVVARRVLVVRELKLGHLLFLAQRRATRVEDTQRVPRREAMDRLERRAIKFQALCLRRNARDALQPQLQLVPRIDGQAVLATHPDTRRLDVEGHDERPVASTSRCRRRPRCSWSRRPS